MAEDEKKLKRCVCAEPIYPGNLPSAPTEYNGTGLCGKCKGTIQFPVPKKEYKPTADETRTIELALSLQGVRKFLEQAMARNNFSLEVDLVPVVLLLDIAGSLSTISERLSAMVENKKDKDKGRDSKRN